MSLPRPTLCGGLFLSAALISLGSAWVNAGLSNALLAALLVSVVLACYVLAFFSSWGIRITREKMNDGVCGETVLLPLSVTNRTFFFRSSCVILEELPFCGEKIFVSVLPALAPKETFLLERKIPARRRGDFSLQRIILRGGDPLGLFCRSVKRDLPGRIQIVPLSRPPRKIPDASGGEKNQDREGRPLGYAGIGNDFFGVRPYRQGDEIRFVHWRCSAAAGKLMVREFEAAASAKVMIVLDTFARDAGQDDFENNFEALISLALSLAEAYSSRYCVLCFVSACGKEIFEISGDAAGIYRKIRDFLTAAELSDQRIEKVTDSILEHIAPGTLLFLLTMSDTPALRAEIDVMENLNVNLYWFHAAKEYFPPVEPGEKRVVLLKHPENRHPVPYLFNSSPEEVFHEI